jgi:hypothetical protein
MNLIFSFGLLRPVERVLDVQHNKHIVSRLKKLFNNLSICTAKVQAKLNFCLTACDHEVFCKITLPIAGFWI